MDLLKLIGNRNSTPTIDFNSVVKCDNIKWWTICGYQNVSKVTLTIKFEKDGMSSILDKNFDNIMGAVEYFYNFLKTL